MKHIKHINELFGLRKLFNKDEETAEGILNSIDQTTKIEFRDDSDDISDIKIYRFNIDEFNIKVSSDLNEFVSEYSLEIDGIKMNCSKSIIKKILTKCYEVINKDNIEQEEYIRKDAKIHFKNR